MSTVDCQRCGEHKQSLKRSPIPGDDGQLVQSTICADCWQEWTEEEVRTINELRLNFMDPEAQATLRQRMMAFLNLQESSAGTADPLCERSPTESTET